MSKLLSKFVRIGVEGDTIDGREISGQHIQDMADTYDPKRYGSRIWPEHFRGLIPGGPFDALGDVAALRAEVISEEGELKGKKALYAQLAPLPALISMNKAGQKIYSSMEVMSNFAKSGKAYLTGLAVTDSPASQGTEMMAFSFGAEGGDVFAGASHEVTLEFETDDKNAQKGNEGTEATLLSRITGMLSKSNKKGDDRYGDVEASITAVAESQQSALDTVENLSTELGTTKTSLQTLNDAHAALKKDFTDLVSKLEKTPAPHSTRTPATGPEGDRPVTDC